MFNFWRGKVDDIPQKQDDDLFKNLEWVKVYLWVKDGGVTIDEDGTIACISSIYGAFGDYGERHNVFKSDMMLYEANALCRKYELYLYNLYRKYAYEVKGLRKLKWSEFKDVLFKRYSSIESKSDFKKARELGYDNFAFLKYCNIAKKLGYSENFAKLTYRPGKEQIQKLELLASENVSRDNMIYFLTK